MSTHYVGMNQMPYEDRVLAWFSQGFQLLDEDEYMSLAYAMMYTAFEEERFVPNPLRNRIDNTLCMDRITRRFPQTLEIHEKALTKILYDENVDFDKIPDILNEVAVAIGVFYEVLRAHERVSLAIFLCRYAVLCWDIGAYKVSAVVVFIVSGMASLSCYVKLPKLKHTQKAKIKESRT